MEHHAKEAIRTDQRSVGVQDTKKALENRKKIDKRKSTSNTRRSSAFST
jgi:hypothetical protein